MKILLLAVLLGAVLASAVAVVYSQHRSRQQFIELQELERMRDDLNEEWGRLQLEQSTWATADRIESMARDKLGMVDPDNRSLVLLKP